MLVAISLLSSAFARWSCHVSRMRLLSDSSQTGLITDYGSGAGLSTLRAGTKLDGRDHDGMKGVDRLGTAQDDDPVSACRAARTGRSRSRRGLFLWPCALVRPFHTLGVLPYPIGGLRCVDHLQ